MLRKCAILGLVLLTVGGLALARLRTEMRAHQHTAGQLPEDSLGSAMHLESYGRWYELTAEEQNRLLLEIDKDRLSKTPEELFAEQQNRLKADLDRLASGDTNAGGFAEYLYGPEWEDEVALHRKRKEQQEITQTASIVCLSLGGTIFGGCSLIWFLGVMARAFKAVRLRRSSRNEPDFSEVTELTDISHDEPEPEPETEDPEEPLAKRRKKLSNELTCAADPVDRGSNDELTDQADSDAFRPNYPSRRRSLATESFCQESTTAVLLSDEPSQEAEWSPMTEWTTRAESEDLSQSTLPGSPAVVQHTARVLDPPQAEEVTDPLKEQADNLQEQIAEFRQVAQSVQQATREQSAPLNNTLKELAEQVSAIREYAASQQGRVEKLQEGYDWNIIRTFCLRVIRCLDNIEQRIDRLDGKGDAATHLEEVRDELLFAMESSGIEQYRPEINSDYHGQEKLAETIRDKESPEGPDQVGRIAKVVRPGYRYMIDEESAKIVRTAQVKLFG